MNPVRDLEELGLFDVAATSSARRSVGLECKKRQRGPLRRQTLAVVAHLARFGEGQGNSVHGAWCVGAWCMQDSQVSAFCSRSEDLLRHSLGDVSGLSVRPNTVGFGRVGACGRSAS